MFKHIIIKCLALMSVLFTLSANAGFIAASWNTNTIVTLDDSLNVTGNFAVGAGASNPNGVTSDGTFLYSGHFGTREVIAYDMTGVEQFRWSNANIGNLQGMTMVGNELAVTSAGTIYFFNPSTGSLIRTVTSAGGTVEGLAYDGTLLWQLADSLIGINPLTGSVVSTIANAAIGESFGGTGITHGNAAGTLILAGTSGNWWEVSSADGSIISSGNNQVNMFGLENINPAGAVPEPATLVLMGLGLLGFAGARRRNK